MPPSTPTAPPSATVGPTPSPTAAASAGAVDVGLEVVASGLSTPIGAIAPPDGSDRLFVIEQTGRIWILVDGQIQPEPFLDLSDRLVDLAAQYDERGLLGLAFHPDFASSDRLFVYYGAPAGEGAAGVDHQNTLSEFRVDATNGNRADPLSERVVLRFGQPQANHSGGALGFGPDGYLYLGTGDGGGTGDDDPGHSPQGNGQDRSVLNGKILRLDVVVDAGAAGAPAYKIPPDNPFVDGGGRPEIYASGFRNPWRLSWEPDGSRRLLVSDVGYGRYEEIDAVERGGNYGWRVREGAQCLNVQAPLEFLADCPMVDDLGTPLSDPVLEYAHRSVGIAVVAGYVYRGTALPAVRGRYVFADYSREFTNDIEGHGTLLVADPAAAPGADGMWPWRRLVVAPLEGITAATGAPAGELNMFITGMGEDADGELYVLVRSEFGPVGETGYVLKLAPPG